MELEKVHPSQESLPGLESESSFEDLESKVASDSYEPENEFEALSAKYGPEDAQKVLDTYKQIEEAENEPFAVDIKEPLLKLIDVICVHSRTEGAQRAHLHLRSEEAELRKLTDLENEIKNIIFVAGKWQETVDRSVVSKEEINDIMEDEYRKIVEAYAGPDNKNKRAKVRRFLGKYASREG